MTLKLKGIAEAVILGNGTPKEIYTRAAILLVLGALEFGMGKFRVSKQVQDLDKRLAVIREHQRSQDIQLGVHTSGIKNLADRDQALSDAQQHLLSRLNYLNGKVNR